MADVISHELHGFFVGQRASDGYVHATALSLIYLKKTGKLRQPSDWYRTHRVKDLSILLSTTLGIPRTALYQVVQGAMNGCCQGTWIHPRLAVPFATWLSPEFELLVSDWVRDWLITGQQPVIQIPVESATPYR